MKQFELDGRSNRNLLRRVVSHVLGQEALLTILHLVSLSVSRQLRPLNQLLRLL
jgi:hypothetical protein